jgi:DNA gyrase subunit B
VSRAVEVMDLSKVRARPGMYIGSTGAIGLFQMLGEVVGNAVDEYLAEHATRVTVEVSDVGWVTVADNGWGMPLRERLTDVFLTLHAGPTLDGKSPHVHVAQRIEGVGVAVVNALCSRFEVESRFLGTALRAAFERGVLVEPLTEVPFEGQGTTIRFLPDAQLFGASRLDLARVEAWLTELSWLCPLLDLVFQGKSLRQPKGLSGLVEALAGQLVPESVFSVHDNVDDVMVELALGWSARGGPAQVRSFVNYRPTTSGSHARGLVNVLGEPEGLVAVVHAGLQHPRFAGPVKAVLDVKAVELAVESALRQAIAERGGWWEAKLRSRA